MYDHFMIVVCNWCIEFLRDIANYTNLSYEEINVWLFIIIQPSLIIIFLILWLIERGKVRDK